MTDNIHPYLATAINVKCKAKQLSQKSIVIWMVGLSGSGKSTLASGLENDLYAKGYHTIVLDGDNLRKGVNNNLGFSDKDRTENIRRTAEVAKLFAFNGTVTICSLICPTEKLRALAKSIIGGIYYEVFINCPLQMCEKRDVKGLYAKARSGEIKDFTGIDAPFESPYSPDIEINTDQLSLEDSIKLLVKNVIPKIELIE